MTVPIQTLGQVELQWCWRVACVEMMPCEIERLADYLIGIVGMTKEPRSPDISHYPNGDGKGGYGIQLYQPLTESFIVISTWPDHGFLRITLASCMPYDPEAVTRFLERSVGKVQAHGGCTI